MFLFMLFKNSPFRGLGGLLYPFRTRLMPYHAAGCAALVTGFKIGTCRALQTGTRAGLAALHRFVRCTMHRCLPAVAPVRLLDGILYLPSRLWRSSGVSFGFMAWIVFRVSFVSFHGI
jgi:hypothetical protein